MSDTRRSSDGSTGTGTGFGAGTSASTSGGGRMASGSRGPEPGGHGRGREGAGIPHPGARPGASIGSTGSTASPSPSRAAASPPPPLVPVSVTTSTSISGGGPGPGTQGVVLAAAAAAAAGKTRSPPPPPPPASPPLAPAETYQLDSSAYDSDSDAESIPDDEYNAIVAEAEAGYTEEEVAQLVAQLKETGLVNFLRTYLAEREDGSRRSLRKLLLGMGLVPPRTLREPGTPDLHLLGFAKVALGRVLRRREKLADVNTVDDAVELLRNAKRIIVLSGAGISTSCGIPDFRSSTGLYAQLQAEGKYDLDDPQQMFDISYFREHPEVFYSFAKQIYPSNFVPSPCHRWIKMLEDRGQLLRNYTQNIDTLESLAGVEKVLQCHGSFKTASCLRCKTRMPGAEIKSYIMSQTIPWCPKCRAERDAEIEAIKAYRASLKGKSKKKAAWEEDDDDDDDIPAWAGEPGIIKPDITFFGQALDSEFDECLFRDRETVDLLVIMGTSLKVAPVSEVLSHIPHSVPQIFINLTPVTHVNPDISLLGDADSIVTYLSHRLGWPVPSAPGRAPDDEIVRIPPDDALWLHGEGDWAHLHMLRSRSARAAEMAEIARQVAAGGMPPEDGDETEDEERDERGVSGTGSGGGSGNGARPAYLLVDPSPCVTPDRRSGSEGSPASDRPAKRSRMGSMEDLTPA